MFWRSPLMESFSFLSLATRGWLNGWVASFFFPSVVMWWCHLFRIDQLSRMGKLSDGHGCLWVCFPCVVVNVHPGSVSPPACNSDYETPHWFKLRPRGVKRKHALLTELLFIQHANSDGVASDPPGKPDHSSSCALPVRPVKGVDTGPSSMVTPFCFATPSVTWWAPALMIHT